MQIFCKQLQLAQIKIILSFGINYSSSLSSFPDNEQFSSFLKTIGVTLISVNQSPVTFPNIEFFNLFENLDGFQNLMITHFRETMKLNIAKIVGNLDIIGSPVFFVSNIAGGFKEVYQKPREGFIKGPLEGFVGIGKGGWTLIQVTTTSTINVFSNFSNSIAHGLTSIAMDKDYI